jgi:hypothetical protein
MVKMVGAGAGAISGAAYAISYNLDGAAIKWTGFSRLY